MRVALVSCVKSKRSTLQAARDLYTSPLFRGLRRYAEIHADSWHILSAKHGLLDPDRLTAPYEQTLNTMGRVARQRWADDVNAQLAAILPAGAEVIILAGVRYREDLVPFLRQRGHPVTIPLEGLSFGRQLQHLNALFASGAVGNTGHGVQLKDHRAAGSAERPKARMTTGRQALLADLTSRAAVLRAIAEFDHLGREDFLDKHGYGPAHRYFLDFNSRQYDSKAIVGVAYGYQFPDHGPLENSQFSGGERTVQRKLHDLGFSLSVLPPARGPAATE